MDSSLIRAGGPNHPEDLGKPSVDIPIVDRILWERWRAEAYKQFLNDIEIGYVDPDLVDFILMIFNRKNHVFTISSCSGRIVLVDVPYPWMRENSTIVFKKHSVVSLDEILRVISLPTLHRLWLIVSGPIFHFVADSLPAAQLLLNVARSVGFKHSGIISIRRDGIVVELISGTWTSFLLKDRDTLVVSNDGLRNIIEIANEILVQGKSRLQNLKNALERIDL